MVRILHDDWSIRLGENTPDQTLKHLAGMLFVANYLSKKVWQFISEQCAGRHPSH